MVKRRPLTAGLNTDPSKEKAFVYGNGKPVHEKDEPTPRKKPTRTKPAPEAAATATTTAPDVPEPAITRPASRSPLTTRLRSDLANALKRASLERELAGQTPHTVQDILEEALEPWLRDNGYLK